MLAALSLVLDFGTIEAGVEAGAPKELEWYLGFGLMVTLVWLYISILKLLALLVPQPLTRRLMLVGLVNILPPPTTKVPDESAKVRAGGRGTR